MVAPAPIIRHPRRYQGDTWVRLDFDAPHTANGYGFPHAVIAPPRGPLRRTGHGQCAQGPRARRLHGPGAYKRQTGSREGEPGGGRRGTRAIRALVSEMRPTRRLPEVPLRGANCTRAARNGQRRALVSRPAGAKAFAVTPAFRSANYVVADYGACAPPARRAMRSPSVVGYAKPWVRGSPYMGGVIAWFSSNLHTFHVSVVGAGTRRRYNGDVVERSPGAGRYHPGSVAR